MTPKQEDKLIIIIIKIDALLAVACNMSVPKAVRPDLTSKKILSAWLRENFLDCVKSDEEIVRVTEEYLRFLRTDFSIGIVNLTTSIAQTNTSGKTILRRFFGSHSVNQEPIASDKTGVVSVIRNSLT